jgi:hypothetical protein
MTNLQKSIVENGKRIIVEMTDLEQEEFETTRSNDLAVKSQKAAEKAALLAKLGITADEAKLLLS